MEMRHSEMRLLQEKETPPEPSSSEERRRWRERVASATVREVQHPVMEALEASRPSRGE